MIHNRDYFTINVKIVGKKLHEKLLLAYNLKKIWNFTYGQDEYYNLEPVILLINNFCLYGDLNHG